MSPTVPLESTLQPHTSSVQQVADSLDTDLIHGLSTDLSNARLAINLNEIGADSGVSILHILVSNIINPYYNLI